VPPQQARGKGAVPNLDALMQQAAEMQAQVQRRQAELAGQTFEGTSGGGVVTAVIRGTGEVVSVTIDPAVLDPDDAEMVEDLVVAAVNAAHQSMAEAAGESFGDLDVAGALGDLGGLGDLGTLGSGLDDLLG
jgi:DNA-binding YbaB/EbfC family protein